MLALKNFRTTAAGDPERGEVGVLLQCHPDGVVPETLTYAKFVADDPEQPAVLVRLEAGAAPGSSPTIELVYSLAPGETGAIPLYLFSRNPVVGEVQATVLTTDGAHDLTIEGSEFELPAMLFGGEMYLVVGEEGLRCQRVDHGTLEECEVDQLRKELRDVS